jgi:4,5-dihydroxyphthalate decarboxylase
MANPQKIRIACRRHDWTDALFDGTINESSLEFIEAAHMRLSNLLADPPEIDFFEYGLGELIQNRAKGLPIKALPVFLRASFRHSYIFVNTKSGIEKPKDLAGKRVGTRYTMPANVWARAALQYDYGVELAKIRWLNQAAPSDSVHKLPDGIVLEPVGREVNLENWLAEGKIDALIHPGVVPTKLVTRPNVKRLFADAAEEERNYYRRTKIVPVMAVIAYREEELQKRPEAVQAVFRAFCRAKEIGLDEMQDNRRSALLWYWESLENQAQLIPDPAPYSIDQMRHTLETFIRYCVEQGLIAAPVALENLFVTGMTV